MAISPDTRRISVELAIKMRPATDYNSTAELILLADQLALYLNRTDETPITEALLPLPNGPNP